MTWAASVLAGPFFVRYGIDVGITNRDGAALNKAVWAYVAVALGAYFVFRAQVLVLAEVGESFLRDLRERRVRPPPAPVAWRSTTARRPA